MAQDEVIDLWGADPPGLDPEQVSQWLGANSIVVPPMNIGLIAAGGSNLTYRLVDVNGHRSVLRRPPVGELLESAHDVVREHRILHGLASTAVPVPEVVGVCADPDVTGAPFYVMRYVEGHIVRTTALGAALGSDVAAVIGRNFFEALAVIHVTAPAAAGLDDLSRPHGYVDRQLRRWHRQYQQTAGDEAVQLEADVHDRLAASIPPDVAPGASPIVHGDYHIDNAVFAEDGTVRAILDWELATSGHPIADLAWALLFWAEPGDANPFLREPPSQAPGFPTRVAGIAAYEAVCHYDLDALPYFEAFARVEDGVPPVGLAAPGSARGSGWAFRSTSSRREGAARAHPRASLRRRPRGLTVLCSAG